MKYNVSDSKLKGIIDEMGEEYKDLLIEKLLNDMHENDVDLINLSELIQLDITTKSSLREDKKIQQRNYILSSISVIGMLYSLFGLMLMMWSDMKESMHFDALMMMAFVLTFLGLFVSVFSMLLKTVFKFRPKLYQEKSPSTTLYEIINKWKEVELLAYQLTPKEKKLSLSQMIKNLKDIQIISEQDIEVINQLLILRNQIVHCETKDINMSSKEIRTLLIKVDKIISKMKKLAYM